MFLFDLLNFNHMPNKLKCVLVDDDVKIHETVRNLMLDCPIAQLTHAFLCPKKFLAEEPQLDFDVCILDIIMPEISGWEIEDVLKKKKKGGVILLSGIDSKVLEAIYLVSPIDVFRKPIEKERLFAALEKARRILNKGTTFTEKFELFSVAQSDGKVKISVADIYYVLTDKKDRRHKHIIMRNGKRYMLMHCTLDKLLSLSSSLIQVNKAELISLQAFQEIDFDLITLDGILENGKPKQVTLSRTYKRFFENKIGIARNTRQLKL